MCKTHLEKDKRLIKDLYESKCLSQLEIEWTLLDPPSLLVNIASDDGRMCVDMFLLSVLTLSLSCHLLSTSFQSQQETATLEKLIKYNHALSYLVLPCPWCLRKATN